MFIHKCVIHVHLECVVTFTLCVYMFVVFVLSFTYSKCILCVCKFVAFLTLFTCSKYIVSLHICCTNT